MNTNTQSRVHEYSSGDLVRNATLQLELSEDGARDLTLHLALLMILEA